MRSTLLQASPFLLFATPALSWGNLGHRTIAYLSEKYMSQEGLDFFNKVVDPRGDWDISDAAIWADTVKRHPEYSHTANWHFIDARDDAPHHCEVVYKRDCDARDNCDSDKSPGCVVGAIASQAARIVSGDNPAEAMKFLLHFVGDVHQPLHAENIERGGNEICIRWHKGGSHHGRSSDTYDEEVYHGRVLGRRFNSRVNRPSDECPPHKKCTNLHSLWDTLMIEKLIEYQQPDKDHVREGEKSAASDWAKELFDDAEGNPALDQNDCVPLGESDPAVDCALAWASESNNYICSFVLKDGVEGVEGKDLSGEYYQGAVPIIKSQITRAARRFAAIVDSLASANSMAKHGQIVMNEL